MSVLCPAGHTSQSTDYCDVCGSPIGAPPPGTTEPQQVSSPPPLPQTQAPETSLCPHCGEANAALSLFCEACGYDFVTGALPFGVEAAFPASPADPPVTPPPDAVAPAPPPDPPAPPPPTAPVTPAGPAGGVGEDFTFVAEIWVDPDWHAEQEVEAPCPSPGLPVVVPLRGTSLLIGRPSVSRNIHPQIDLSSDVGVSRRHAQLTTDGQRWYIEDLGSSNGTYIGSLVGQLPKDPIGPGRKEIGDDDRVFLGAWTRIVVREATAEELQEL